MQIVIEGVILKEINLLYMIAIDDVAFLEDECDRKYNDQIYTDTKIKSESFCQLYR